MTQLLQEWAPIRSTARNCRWSATVSLLVEPDSDLERARAAATGSATGPRERLAGPRSLDDSLGAGTFALLLLGFAEADVSTNLEVSLQRLEADPFATKGEGPTSAA